MTDTLLPETEQRPYWFVVADESKAVIYESRARYGALQRGSVLQNEAAREKTGEMISDRGGRSHDSHGEGRHTYQKEKVDPKTHVSIGFAKRIISRVLDGKRSGDCDQFALIAAPRFLGLLRDQVGVAGVGEPFAAIAKNVVNKSPAEIQKLIAVSRP